MVVHRGLDRETVSRLEMRFLSSGKPFEVHSLADNLRDDLIGDEQFIDDDEEIETRTEMKVILN